MSTGRLEAFSDGVLAVAITLLILNVTVPAVEDHGGHLGHELLKMWPEYVAYATSFITIGIIWINHHAMIGRLRQADHAILTLNLLLLMSIVVIPFATSLVTKYIREPHGGHLAAAVYAGSMLVMSIVFSLLNRHILLSKPSYLIDEISLELRRRIFSRALTGLIPYALATAVAPLSAYLTLGICSVVAIFYALPVASGDTILTTDGDPGR